MIEPGKCGRVVRNYKGKLALLLNAVSSYPSQRFGEIKPEKLIKYTQLFSSCINQY